MIQQRQVNFMDENSPGGKGDHGTPEFPFPHSLYIPEEERIQRIPLCRYLSDLSALFETDNAAVDSSEKKPDRE